MPNWKKVIVSGSDAILSSITSSAGISSSGDIYAPNFIGTASIASAVTVTPLGSFGFFDVLFTNGSNLFLTDDTTTDFAYNPSNNTLLVDNLVGTASLATTSSYVISSNVYGPHGFNSILSSSHAINASHSISASYAENGIDILDNINNRVFTATGNNTLQGESNLTFDGSTLSTAKLTLNANNPLIVSSQAGQALTVNDDDLNLIKIGDIGGGQNETLFTVNDSATKITFYTNGINSEFNPTGLKTTGNITSSGNISASGDLYGRDLDVSRDVKLGRNIVVPINGKIGIPSGIDSNDDYILFGNDSARNISLKFDNSDLFKVDYTGELISLLESTKHGENSDDTHQFTGSVDIKGNTNIDGNLIIDGDITAQQYIINSTVTNVTMSFSSGSTIFGDSTDDTHLFTGSVTASGNISASGNLNADHLILNPNTTTTGSSDTDAAINISLGEESYKSGVIKRVFDFRENIPSADVININEQVIADIGEFTKGTFEFSLELKGVRLLETLSLLIPGTGSIHQSINLSGQTNNEYAIGSAVDIVYSDESNDILFSAMVEMGTNFAPIDSVFSSLVAATQPPFLKEDSGKLKFNFGVPNDVNLKISGSLATVYLNYQLYK